MKDAIWKLDSGLWAVRVDDWTYMVMTFDDAVLVLNNPTKHFGLTVGVIA